MPRRKRIVALDVPHHVTQRGNNRRTVFFDDGDREVYLSLLVENCERFGVGLMGFCLMTNHVHVVAVPKRANSLAKAFGRTHHDYARWLHIRRRESGHLWQNRFFSCPMDEAYCWATLAYIERNPVRAGLVARAEDSPWSSAAMHLGCGRSAPWLELDRWSNAWSAKSWSVALKEGLYEAELRNRVHEATQGGRPLGSAQFLEECEARFNTQLRKQKPGRKPKAKAA